MLTVAGAWGGGAEIKIKPNLKLYEKHQQIKTMYACFITNLTNLDSLLGVMEE